MLVFGELHVYLVGQSKSLNFYVIILWLSKNFLQLPIAHTEIMLHASFVPKTLLLAAATRWRHARARNFVGSGGVIRCWQWRWFIGAESTLGVAVPVVGQEQRPLDGRCSADWRCHLPPWKKEGLWIDETLDWRYAINFKRLPRFGSSFFHWFMFRFHVSFCWKCYECSVMSKSANVDISHELTTWFGTENMG